MAIASRISSLAHPHLSLPHRRSVYRCQLPASLPAWRRNAHCYQVGAAELLVADG